jgi:hypothetical protein
MPRIGSSVITLALVGVLAGVSAKSQTISIPLVDPPRGDRYAWITQLSTGPVSWSGTPDSEVAGHFFRVVVTTTEIYNDVFVERLTLGEEGFDKRLVSTRMMDVETMASAFAIRGEFAGLRVEQWDGPDAFVMSINQRRFRVTLTGEDLVLMDEIE